MARLSIAIPTKDRPALLARLLNGMLDDLASLPAPSRDEVIISISDNSSSGDTFAVVHAFSARYPNICFNRNSENIGFSRNILRAVEQSSADYVYLCGDDDEWLHGSFSSLLNAANSGLPVILVNTNSAVRPDGNEMLQRLTGLSAVIEHFGVFHLTFIGNILIRREEYLARMDSVFLASAYPHTYAVGRSIQIGGAGFLNRSIVRVDDSHRAWTGMRFCYYSIDLPAIVSALHEVSPLSRPALWNCYVKGVKSLPFAIWASRSIRFPLKVTPFSDLSLSNIRFVYRGSAVFRCIAHILGRIAYMLPECVVKWCQQWKIRKEGAVFERQCSVV